MMHPFSYFGFPGFGGPFMGLRSDLDGRAALALTPHATMARAALEAIWAEAAGPGAPDSVRAATRTALEAVAALERTLAVEVARLPPQSHPPAGGPGAEVAKAAARTFVERALTAAGCTHVSAAWRDTELTVSATDLHGRSFTRTLSETAALAGKFADVLPEYGPRSGWTRTAVGFTRESRREGFRGTLIVDTTTTGAGTVNDGASRIGLGAFGSWAGGTLQAYLLTVGTAVTSIATKVAKAGDTMTGDLTFVATKKVKYSDTTTRPARGRWVLSTGVTDLSVSTGGGVLAQINTAQAVVSADYEFYPVTGDTITAVKAAAIYTGSPHGGEPGTKPTIALWKWAIGDSTPNVVAGPFTDPETVAGDYESPHNVTLSGFTEVVGSDARYFVRFTSEDGANQAAGYAVTHVSLTTVSAGLPPGL